MIFSTKSLIYTCVTGAIGLIFYYIFGKVLGMTLVGIGITLAFAAIGFMIGTVKIPELAGLPITKKISGEYIDVAFLKWLKFRKKGKVIYTFLGAKEEDN